MKCEDDLRWLAWTIWMEARGEPFEGKVAVAYVIINRVMDAAGNMTVSDIVLAPMQFSCWNSHSGTRKHLSTIPEMMYEECYKAACSAYFTLEPDPTHGARFYFNPSIVKPSWAAQMVKTVEIGGHHFYRV